MVRRIGVSDPSAVAWRVLNEPDPLVSRASIGSRGPTALAMPAGYWPTHESRTTELAPGVTRQPLPWRDRMSPSARSRP